jgi:hypothetical protein
MYNDLLTPRVWLAAVLSDMALIKFSGIKGDFVGLLGFYAKKLNVIRNGAASLLGVLSGRLGPKIR